MTLSELRTELLARGFDTVSDERARLMINAAIQEVDSMAPWPYREDSGEGIAPMSVPLLGEIEAVTNETLQYPLDVVPYRNLLDDYGDLSTAGTPQFAYRADPGGIPTVSTYPTSTDTIGVQFWLAPPTLVADSDAPYAPTRFSYVYLAVASRMATAESDGNVGQWQAEVDRGLQMMQLQLLGDQVDGQQQRLAYDSLDW